MSKTLVKYIWENQYNTLMFEAINVKEEDVGMLMPKRINNRRFVYLFPNQVKVKDNKLLKNVIYELLIEKNNQILIPVEKAPSFIGKLKGRKKNYIIA